MPCSYSHAVLEHLHPLEHANFWEWSTLLSPETCPNWVHRSPTKIRKMTTLQAGNFISDISTLQEQDWIWVSYSLVQENMMRISGILVWNDSLLCPVPVHISSQCFIFYGICKTKGIKHLEGPKTSSELQIHLIISLS